MKNVLPTSMVTKEVNVCHSCQVKVRKLLTVFMVNNVLFDRNRNRGTTKNCLSTGPCKQMVQVLVTYKSLLNGRVVFKAEIILKISF